MKNAAETILEVRRGAWLQIRKVTQSDLPDREKLHQCLNISGSYSAMTGDDSLTPPRIKTERQQMLDSLPGILKTAARKQKQKEHGVVELF